MDPKTKQLVEEAEARAARATPGPWRNTSFGSVDSEVSTPSSYESCTPDEFGHTISIDCDSDRAIAEFIAHARTDIPALCSAVREQDERIAELEQDAESCDEYEAAALRHIGEEVIAGRQHEARGELPYWIGQIHEHYKRKLAEQDKRVRHAETERNAFDERIAELDAQLKERNEAATAWGALAIARLKTINEQASRLSVLDMHMLGIRAIIKGWRDTANHLQNEHGDVLKRCVREIEKLLD